NPISGEARTLSDRSLSWRQARLILAPRPDAPTRRHSVPTMASKCSSIRHPLQPRRSGDQEHAVAKWNFANDSARSQQIGHQRYIPEREIEQVPAPTRWRWKGHRYRATRFQNPLQLIDESGQPRFLGDMFYHVQ